MNIVYFDCYSGASGDMLLGSLLHAGLPLEALRAQLERVPLSGYSLAVTPCEQHGIHGLKLDVLVTNDHHPHRHLADIAGILTSSELPEKDIRRGLEIFRRLARAEARVHGCSIEEVHFHEVGAVDSIIDVVGFVIGIRLLEIEQVFSSPLPLGSGFVQTAHGRLPVPAPATLEILSEVGAPTTPGDAQAEMVTPTGAAILSELAVFHRPAMRVHSVGYGFGNRIFHWPNAVRAMVAEVTEPVSADGYPPDHDTVMELQCNIDDMSAEQLGYVLERLFEAGALDVWFTPIQMKKNRPAVMISVLCRPEERLRTSTLLLSESSTLGVRYRSWKRHIADRETLEVHTPWGPTRVKIKRLQGIVTGVSPEYGDCARLAREAGVPLARVYEAVCSSYRQDQYQQP